MTENRLPSPRFQRAALFLITFLIAAQAITLAEPLQTASAPEQFAYRPHDPQNLAAFGHFYNLDYDRAVQEFEQVLSRHPDDPFAVNHLLTVVLFRELYRMGVLNTGEYANDSFISAPHRPADPKIKLAPAAAAQVEQGKIENSNVSPAESAVRLVSVMRQFEMLNRAVALGSDMSKRAIKEVARVGS